MPAEIDFVHSLEHGRMEIQYSPELPEQDQLALKGLYDTMYGGALLFPNERCSRRSPRRPGRTCSAAPSTGAAITDDAIRAFGKATWGSRPRGDDGFRPLTGPSCITHAVAVGSLSGRSREFLRENPTLWREREVAAAGRPAERAA